MSQSIGHLRHHEESADISHPELTRFNSSWEHPSVKNLSSAINEVVKTHNDHSKRALRKDASVGAEFVFSYSQHDLDFDPAFMQEFEKRVLQFLFKEMQTFVPIRIDRHCDESSVHWHVVGFCFADKAHTRVSTRNVLGGPRELSERQTRFAEYVADLGLERGIPKNATRAKHTSKREWERSAEIGEMFDTLEK